MKRRLKLVMKIVIVLSIVLALYLLWDSFSKTLFLAIVDVIKSLAKVNTFLALNIIGLIITICSMILMPGKTSFFVLVGYALNEFWLSFFVIFGWTGIELLLSYYFASRCFKKCLSKKLEKFLWAKVLMRNACKEPWKTSILVQLLYVPASYKNYALTISGIGFWPYFVCAYPLYIFWIGFFLFVGVQMNNIDELFESTSFSEKDTNQKINFVVTWTFIPLSVLILIILFIKTRI